MLSRHPKLFCAVVQSLLEEGLSVRFRASGRSMLPALRDGEYLIVGPARAANVDLGDVLLCDRPRGPVAHRLVSVDQLGDGQTGFTLRGDASLECDGPVVAPAVIGRIVSCERDGRRVSLVIRGGRLGRVALLASLRVRLALVAALRPWLPPLRLLRGAGTTS